MVTLRPYQDKAVADISAAFNRDGHRRVLFVLPTGGGKTMTFAYIASKFAAAGKRLWILAHRDELLRQISETLFRFNVTHGVLRGGGAMSCDKIQVCSVQTLANRLSVLTAKPDMIVIDEAHHAVAGSWRKVAAALAASLVLGVTATPCRLDGRGLSEAFDHMVVGPTTAWLTNNGYLAPAMIYAPELVDTSAFRARDYTETKLAAAVDKPAICGDAVAHYLRFASGKRMLVFCVNLTHVGHVVAEYRSAGIAAEALDGSMTMTERTARVARFTAGETPVLVTCDLVSEGFDVPGCDGIQQLRPTQSESLNLQQVGRALRTAPGKTHAIILDHVRNWERHGLPTDPREWSLDAPRRSSRNNAGNVGCRQCMKCYFIYPSFTAQCPNCGHVPPVADRTPDVVAGELSLVSAPVIEPPTPEERERLLAGHYTLKGWHEVAKRLGYSHKWAWRKHQESL